MLKGCLVGRQSLLDFEDLLGDGHFQLDDLGQIREPAGFFTVEDLLAIEINLQAPLAVRGQLQSNVAGSIRPPEFIRQPRGDGEVASRYAVKDLDFYFSKLGTGHSSPRTR